MTRTFKTFAAVAAIALGVSAPAFAQSQLIASAGLTAAEAQGLTLNQIAAAKYNRGRSFTDRQAVVIEPVSGAVDRTQLSASVDLAPSASLNEIAAAKYNRDESYADRQIVKGAGVTVATRSVAGTTGDWSQLIASAGLSSDEARGLTLDQIVAAKYNRDESYADHQKVRN